MLKQKILDLKYRLEQMFQVQTIEVITELNKMLELLEDKQEVKIEKTAETTIQETAIESKDDLIKQYIEKYNKKPFAWRSIDVLKSKLK